LLDAVLWIEPKKVDEYIEGEGGGVILIVVVFVVGGFNEIVDEVEIDVAFVPFDVFKDKGVDCAVIINLFSLPGHVSD
jgi:hypothetical protein